MQGRTWFRQRTNASEKNTPWCWKMYGGNQEGLCYTAPFTLPPNPAREPMNRWTTAPPFTLCIMQHTCVSTPHQHAHTRATPPPNAQEQCPSQRLSAAWCLASPHPESITLRGVRFTVLMHPLVSSVSSRCLQLCCPFTGWYKSSMAPKPTKTPKP